MFYCFYFIFFRAFFLKFYFIFKLYITVLVLPNIKMNTPQVKKEIIFKKSKTAEKDISGMRRKEKDQDALIDNRNQEA